MCLELDQAKNSNEGEPWRPGVYVFWQENRVIKVGRSLANARKRAFEHFPADTGGEMRLLKNDPDARLLLFLMDEEATHYDDNRGPDNLHWVIALEDFFEQRLDPLVPSDRRG